MKESEVLQSDGGAPEFAKEKPAPGFVKAHEEAHSPNTSDPAHGKGKMTDEAAKGKGPGG